MIPMISALMQKNFLLLLCCFLLFLPVLSAEDNLVQGFATPPDEARLWAYWEWLNGNVTEAALTRDLEQAKEKGFGGFVIFDVNDAEQKDKPLGQGPMFGTPEWTKLYLHTVREADRLGLSLSLSIMSGWNLGGPNVTPEFAAKQIVSSETVLNGGQTVNVAISQPKARHNYYRDIAVLAFRISDKNAKFEPVKLLDQKNASKELGGSAPDCRPLLEEEPTKPGEEVFRVEDILNITDKMNKKGELNWEAPAGTWKVLRFGYTLTGAKVSTASGGWQGLVIDHLSAEAFDFYWDGTVVPLLDAARPYCGKSLRYIHTDSWEAGGMNWTPTFREEFQKRRGYDPIPYLPVLAGHILIDRNTSNRFLNDFRRTVGDLIAVNHYELLKTYSTKYRLGVHPESGGPHGAPIDSLQLLGMSDIPMSEYWSWSPRHRIGDANRFFTKQPASAAHTNGHKIVAAEGFTNIGMNWQESFSHNLKPSFDQAVCEGMNLLVWHGFACSPDELGVPGQEYFAGTHFNPKHFTWQKSKDFLSYINRVQFLLQQGVPSADVLEYYGESVPNFTQGKGANTAKSLPGYDYDVAAEDVLLNQVSGVQNGRIVLKDGMSYRILVLPERDSISRKALEKVETLVRSGATVIGPKPLRTTGLDAQPMTTELWNGKTGAGRVLSGQTARDVLLKDGVPLDFERTSGSSTQPRLDWIHRTVYKNQYDAVSLRKFADFLPKDVSTVPADVNSGVAAEIYYVANLSELPDEAVCAFRVVGRQPELWDPLTGTIHHAEAFQQTENVTKVPLSFASYGSIFVIFRKEIDKTVQGSAAKNGLQFTSAVELSKPWTVRFSSLDKTAEFKNLESWTKHEDPAIKYYSGIAVYSQDVDLPKYDGRVFLELGNVCELAEVKVNGRSLGTIWAAPFQCEITSALKVGANRIEIEAANHWANRIIGDASKPESERQTRTNIIHLKADTPLVDSGLIGPARLRIAE
jgi:hypothetical protein